MQSNSSMSRPRATVRGFLVLMLIVCLVEATTGSCLSYGHSCWGAHGKRSGKPPASAPDWYITRVLRRMAANSDLQNRAKHLEIQNADDIYRVGDDTTSSNRFIGDSEDISNDMGAKSFEAKPMLDDNILSKLKLWQIMRAASDEK